MNDRRSRFRCLIAMLLVVAWALVACERGLMPTFATQSATTTPTATQTYTRMPTPGTVEVLDLGEALAQGLVEARIRGNGASSGDSIIVELTCKVARTLELSIPAGTVLRSQDLAAQNMIVLGVRGVPIGGGKFRPASTMRLTSDAPQEFLLAAYCLDFDKANPSGGTGFSVGELASPEVQALLKALDQAPVAQYSIGAIQAAIWVATDDVCRSELSARFPASAADIQAALDLIAEAGIDPATTCLSGQSGVGLPSKTSASPTQPSRATSAPVPTTVPPTLVRPTITRTPVQPTATPRLSASTPTAVAANRSVTGDLWQVTVISVARMKRLECSSGGERSIHVAEAGHEILEVMVEFAPIEKREEMSVSTEHVALIDGEGKVHMAIGGGAASKAAVSGRRSSSCCLGGSGRECVVESYLVRETLTTSFFFAVAEGQTGHKFQFMDYPAIPLNE